MLCLCAPLLAAATPPPAETRAEIDHLLRFLERSGCEFYRNGSWHAAAAARAHLDKKYDYLVNNGLVQRTEDFVHRAASTSSVSGKPYLVRCGGSTPVPSAQWFTDELRRHRATGGDSDK